MLISPVNSSIRITRLYDKRALKICLKKENQLGQGSFGCAYQVTHPLNNGLMVCKVIDLQGKSKHFHLSSHHLLRLAYRELTYLQKVNMLIGYFHDENNHKMYILMKYIKGRSEWSINKIKNPSVEYLSFCALRACHRQGIAHNDPHQGNFLIDQQLQVATVIDFGLAKTHNPFREIRDYYKFLKKRNAARAPLSLERDLTYHHLLQFYCEEMHNYIKNNKLEMAKQLFIYSAIIISASCGVSVLGAASLIAQQLIKMVLLQRLSELCETIEDIYEIRGWNQINSKEMRHYYQAITALLVVLQGFLFALNISSLYSSSSLCWQRWVNLTPPVEMAYLVLALKPLIHAIEYWRDFCEKYLFSDTHITNRYEKHLLSQVYLPQYHSKRAGVITRSQSHSHLPGRRNSLA